MILIRTIFIYFISKQEWYERWDGICNSKMCPLSVALWVPTRVTLFRTQIILIEIFKKRSVFTLFSFNKVASSLFSLFSRQKFVFQSEHFGSKIKLKISPLPRAWKRTNILNADKVTQSKFQTPKRGGSPIWGGRCKCWSWCCPESEAAVG